MKPLRVVLYAEGAGETGGERRLLPPPGEKLEEEHLGAAHLLLRRCLQQNMNGSDREIVFEAPLRTNSGRTARGSDFLSRTTLRRLLTWLDPQKQPDCAVVLVDQDEVRQRRKKLEEDTQDLPSLPVIGVAGLGRPSGRPSRLEAAGWRLKDLIL